MSSGWPPEDDDRRWEPARHPSAVGAAHESRGAEGGHPGFADYQADGQYPEGQYAGEQYAEGQYSEGQQGSWYGTAETSYPPVDYRPQPDNAGYGEVSYPDVYDLSAPADGGFPEQGYGPYEPAPGYGPPAGYTEHPSFPNLPAQPPYGAPAAADYDTSGYQNGYAGQDFGPAGYPQAGSAQAEFQAGEFQQGDFQQAGETAGPDYGYADYGDPRYDDPSFGEPAYADAPSAGYPAPAPSPESAAPPAGQQPGAPYSNYYEYPPSYYETDHGYGPGQGYAVPDPGTTGYVAAEYASGQFPDGVGALGDLSAGQPDPGATGMLDASGMLDATGISDNVELYNYHPGAGAEAAHTFSDAPAPMGTLDTSGLALPPDATMIDGHAPILGGAEAADAAGVLDGGTASTYFAEAPAFGAAQAFSPAPAYADQATGYDGDTTAYAGDEAAFTGAHPSGPVPAFGSAVAADVTSLDLPPANSFDRGPADSAASNWATSTGATSTGATKTGGTGALLRPRSTRPAGKRRGGSGDRRLWFALGGVLIVAAAAITAIVLVAFPSGPSGPAHTLVSPNQLGAFTRRPALEQQMNVGQLRQDVVNTSSGQASHVVEGVYESGSSAPGSTPQIILLIGGNLANANPVDSVTSFTKRFKGATVTSAGTMAGKAVCVNATASEPGSVAMCAWFDNDSFGEVVSPTMKASTLASTMRQIRPKVELVAKNKP
jgi:hypothetical protein